MGTCKDCGGALFASGEVTGYGGSICVFGGRHSPVNVSPATNIKIMSTPNPQQETELMDNPTKPIDEEPPEDLRAEIERLVECAKKGDATYAVASEILRLCEAAALAALPEKHETINGTDMWNIGKGHHLSQEKLMENSYWNGSNSAIATTQANIHSVFGGTK